MISPEYLEQNRQLHADRPEYGVSGGRDANAVLAIAHRYQAGSLLDYGCGKGMLKIAIDVPMAWHAWAYLKPPPIAEYDPAIAGKDTPPEPADLVICGDVLEHVEPEHLEAVLADLARLTKLACFMHIATREALKTLPDGRNAHLTIEPSDWWLTRLAEHFNIVEANDFDGKAFRVLGTPLHPGLGRRQDA